MFGGSEVSPPLPVAPSPPPGSPASPAGETFSYSRLGSFKNCKASYKYRYVDKIPAEDEGVEAFMGKQVHAALEFLYKELKSGRLADVQEVLAVYERCWAEQDSPRVVVAKRGMEKKDFRIKGQGFLEDYYRRNHPFSGGDILMLEGRLLFTLGSAEAEPIRFQAILDRLMKVEDGVLEIHDYKTGKRLPSQADLDQDGQLALYEIAVRKNLGHQGPVNLVWHFLAHGKTLTSNRTAGALESLESQLVARVKDVLQARETGSFPPTPGPLCYYCSYKAKCRADYRDRGERHPLFS